MTYINIILDHYSNAIDNERDTLYIQIDFPAMAKIGSFHIDPVGTVDVCLFRLYTKSRDCVERLIFRILYTTLINDNHKDISAAVKVHIEVNMYAKFDGTTFSSVSYQLRSNARQLNVNQLLPHASWFRIKQQQQQATRNHSTSCGIRIR